MKSKPFQIKRRVFILSSASVVGSKEADGPLSGMFDLAGEDKYKKDSWEQAEAEMQRLAVGIALHKSSMDANDIDVMFAGDLINQCISSSYGLSSYRIPFLGIFGACSTCAEGLTMGALYTSTVCDRAVCVTSSHFCSAERQFRSPMEYGGQRAPTSQWTVTGSGAFVLTSLTDDLTICKDPYIPEIVEVMPGCVVDRGITDANNMGAAMAPSAADTIQRFVKARGNLKGIDAIFTGDLGIEGSAILIDLLKTERIDIEKLHHDCGKIIFDEESDTHAGGSGCGCSAVVLATKILSDIRKGRLKDVLFIATGALMNAMAINQKLTIPGVAHLVHIVATPREEIE